MAWKSVGGAVIGGGIALTLTAVAAPIVLPAIGFSTGGVVTGSLAAAAQSAMVTWTLEAALEPLAVSRWQPLALLQLPELRREQELALEQR